MTDAPIPAAERDYQKAQRQIGMFAIWMFLLDMGIFLAGMFAGSKALEQFVFNVLLAAALVQACIFAVLLFRLSKLAKAFWLDLAAEYGFTYIEKPSFPKAPLLFREGHSKRASHGLEGTLDGRGFGFFQYVFVTGSGKSSKTHNLSVLELSFPGTFPHLFVNVRNWNLVGLDSMTLPEIRLPSEAEGKFRLYGPKGYEIEALDIFSPDVVAHLIDAKWPHDFELIGGKLYIYSELQVDTRAELQADFARIRALLGLIGAKLDRYALAEVGDLTHTL